MLPKPRNIFIVKDVKAKNYVRDDIILFYLNHVFILSVINTRLNSYNYIFSNN